MRYVICVILLCCTWLQGFCDERSTAIIGGVVQKLSSMGSYEVTFTARSQGQMEQTQGYYLVSGDSYYMTLGDKSVWADGKSKYEVDEGKMEVVISTAQGSDKNILSNPASAFDFLDGSFTHAVKGSANIGSRTTTEIALTSTQKGSAVKGIALVVDNGSSLPLSIEYSVEGMSAPIEIVIGSVKALKSVPAARLRFDRSRYKGFEMIDFR